MLTFKDLIKKSVTKEVEFMSGTVVISKLSVADVKRIQKMANTIDKETGDGGLELMVDVIKTSVADASEMTIEDFSQMPFDELQGLSNMIMEFSGMREGNAS
jgi:hypothetical protein